MGCSKSRPKTHESQSESFATVQQVEMLIDHLSSPVQESALVDKVELLMKDSEQLTSMVAGLETKLSTLDQKFEENDKAFDQIHGRIETLARRSKAIRKREKKQDENLPTSNKDRMEQPLGPTEILGERDQNIICAQ